METNTVKCRNIKLLSRNKNSIEVETIRHSFVSKPIQAQIPLQLIRSQTFSSVGDTGELEIPQFLAESKGLPYER